MSIREFKAHLYDILRDHNVPIKECISILNSLDKEQLTRFIKMVLILLIPFIICSCASVNTNDRYGFFPSGMSEDAQDRPYNTKYNLMDSTDGKQDPNANLKVWGATY